MIAIAGETAQHREQRGKIPHLCLPWVGKVPWRRNGYPLQYSCLGEFNGERSLVGYSPQGHQELDMTEGTNTHTHTHTHVYVALVVKNLCANAGDIRDVSSISGLGRSPGGRHDDPSHSNILAWKIPWAEKPGGLWSRGCKELDMTEQLTLPLFSLLLASRQRFP